MKLFGETLKNRLYFGNSMKTPIIVVFFSFKKFWIFKNGYPGDTINW